MRRALLATACAAGIAAVLLPGTANAMGEDIPLLTVIAQNTAATNTSVVTGTNTISNAITSSAESIVQALQALQAQEMTNLSVSQQAQANMQQVIDRQNVATQIARERLDAMKSATSGYSSCNTIYGGQAAQAFTPALLSYKEGLFKTDNEFINNQRVIDGTPQPSGESLSLTTQASVESHCQQFASESDIDQGICPSGTKVSQDPAADTDIGHLEDQLAMNSQDQTASQAFLRMAVNPLPFAPMPPTVAGTEVGQEEALQRQSLTARLSVAYQLLAIGLTNRAPIQNDAQLLDWAEGTAKDTGYTPSSSGQYFPNGVSLDAYQQLRADSWVEDTNFTNSLSGASETTLIKDLFDVEAFRAQVEVEQKQISEQIAAGIGVLIANSIQTNPGIH